MVEPKRPRGRPPKYPKAEVRERLITSARGSLANGLSFGVDIATLEGAIEEGSVPRGVSYRTWRGEAVGEESPQDALRVATIVDIVQKGQDKWLEKSRSFTSVQATALRNGDETLQQVLRDIGSFGHKLVDETHEIALVRAFRATAATQKDTPAAIVDALTNDHTRVIAAYTEMANELAQAAGVGLRSGRKASDFIEAFFSVTQGLTQNGPGTQRPLVQRPTGTNGESEPWTLAGITIEALVRQFFDWEPERG